MAAACLAASLAQAAPYWAEQMQLHVIVRPCFDLGISVLGIADADPGSQLFTPPAMHRRGEPGGREKPASSQM